MRETTLSFCGTVAWLDCHGGGSGSQNRATRAAPWYSITMEAAENISGTSEVESGQLRQWRYAGLGEGLGETFLVLSIDPNFENEPFWRVLLISGGTKLWSQTRIKGWSEVISEAR